MKISLLLGFLLIPFFVGAEVVDFNDVAVNEDEIELTQYYGDEDDYEKREYLGFNIYMELDVLDSQAEKTEAAYSLVASQLLQMKLLLPIKVMEKLETKKVKIVINDDCGDTDCDQCAFACYISYFPFVDEFKSKAVVFRDVDALLRDFRSNNSLLLHEFGHAFHNLIVPDGYDNQTIKDAWLLAVYSRKFEKVNYITRRLDTYSSKVEHYLMRNDEEYFAEISAALWLRSSWKPFVFHQVFTNELLTDQTKIKNPIWDAWWDHSGPHEPGRTWYWETLNEEDDSVLPNASEIPILLDLDHEHE
ncbi:MAG: hypothetical protein F4W92_09150 [Gammaproteobacteria bacterium]|nr:hypothetical protein [Gammaproteobacteria bacterium]